ncbi:MAG TPA: hypothetical protein VFN99_11795 [Gaiella sp.]|nr:hypothetical protein [Gaiella sp.]
MNGRLATIVIAGLAIAVTTTAALAAPTAPTAGLTGVWSGKTHQDIQPLSDDGEVVEFKQRITIRAMNGRLTYLGVNVAYTCPNPDNPMRGDMSLDLGWDKVKDRPKLRPNGGFSLNVTHAKNPFTKKLEKLYVPVHISGALGRGGASGSFSIGNNTCNGKGTWQAKRKF